MGCQLNRAKWSPSPSEVHSALQFQLVHISCIWGYDERKTRSQRGCCIPEFSNMYVLNKLYATVWMFSKPFSLTHVYTGNGTCSPELKGSSCEYCRYHGHLPTYFIFLILTAPWLFVNNSILYLLPATRIMLLYVTDMSL